MGARRFTLLIQPAKEGGFVVKYLEMPVASQGKTREEALANIKEARASELVLLTKRD